MKPTRPRLACADCGAATWGVATKVVRCVRCRQDYHARKNREGAARRERALRDDRRDASAEEAARIDRILAGLDAQRRRLRGLTIRANRSDP